MSREFNLYGVLSLREEIVVDAFGFEAEVKLQWAEGQIGAMPVFSSKKEALDYVDNDESRVFGLIAQLNKEG